MSFKDTNITNPGTSIKYGADDMEVIARMFNGVTTGIPPVTIKSTNKWGFWDNILFIRNQADTKSTTIRGQSNSPTTDVTLTLPPITANDVLPAIGLTQTWALKQLYDSGVVMKQMTNPSAPSSSYHHLFIASNGHLTRMNSSGVMVDYDAIVSPAVDLKDGLIALRRYDAHVFRVGTTYYAIKSDGSVINSGTNPGPVIQSALNVTGDILIGSAGANGIDAYKIVLQAGFAGWDIPQYSNVFITKDTNIYVPANYTGYVFRITTNECGIFGEGSYINDNESTVSRGFTAVQVGTGNVGDDIADVTLRGLYCYQCKTGIEIKQGNAGSVKNISIEDCTASDAIKGMLWTVADSTKVKNIIIQNFHFYANGSVETDCFKSVAGTRNSFVNCFIDDNFSAAASEMNISSLAVDTMIFGGNCTGGKGTFTDSGTNTYIDDSIHAEVKLKGDPVNATISADTNNFNPTGWSEKKNILRVTATGAQRMITGLVPGSNPKNRIVRLLNVGTQNIMLVSESSSSTAANRFKLITDVMVMPNQSTSLLYDSTDSRWRPLSDAMSAHAMTNAANIWTETQTIKKDSDVLLVLYRPVTTIGAVVSLDWQFNNSLGTQTSYVSTFAELLDATDNSEDANWQLYAMSAGVMEPLFYISGGEHSWRTAGGNWAIWNSLNLTADRSFSLPDLSTQLAGVDANNIFTTNQTIRRSGAATFLTLYRQFTTTFSKWSLLFDANDSLSNQTTYAGVHGEIVSATDTTEKGAIVFNVMKSGTLTDQCYIDETGFYIGQTGTNNIRFMNTGLTADRLFTFPNLAGQVATQEFANIFTAAQTITLNTQNLLIIYRTANTVGNNSSINLDAQSSTNVQRTYGAIRSEIVTNTNAAEMGDLLGIVMRSGTAEERFRARGSNGDLIINNKNVGSGCLALYRPANSTNNEVDASFIQQSSTSVDRTYAKLSGKIITNTNASEDGEIEGYAMRGGTLQNVFRLLNTGDIKVGRDNSNLRGMGSYFFTSSNDQVFNNTTAEQTLVSQTVKGAVMGADAQCYLKMSGYILQNQATGTTYTFKIKVGGTIIWEGTFGGSIAQSATKRPWFAEVRLFPANQSTTSARMNGFFILNDTTAPTTGQGSITDATIGALGSIRAEGASWTFANDTVIAVTCTMSVANAATEICMDQFTMEYAPS